NREAYSTHCKEYAEYQKWLKERNPARWKTNKEHGQIFDSKNLMNLVRLIISAERIVKNGTLNIDMTDHRDLLLGIKNGTVDLEVTKDEWLKRADNLKELFAKSDLPDRFEEERLREIELQLRNYKKQYEKPKTFFRR